MKPNERGISVGEFTNAAARATVAGVVAALLFWYSMEFGWFILSPTKALWIGALSMWVSMVAALGWSALDAEVRSIEPR